MPEDEPTNILSLPTVSPVLASVPFYFPACRTAREIPLVHLYIGPSCRHVLLMENFESALGIKIKAAKPEGATSLSWVRGASYSDLHESTPSKQLQTWH